jgi:hypothetical protein
MRLSSALACDLHEEVPERIVEFVDVRNTPMPRHRAV